VLTFTDAKSASAAMAKLRAIKVNGVALTAEPNKVPGTPNSTPSTSDTNKKGLFV
jgi:hypothetical protein